MKLSPVYAIADARGNALVEVEGTIEQAVEQHLSRHGREAPLFFDGDLLQLEKNKDLPTPSNERLPNGTSHASRAIKNLGNRGGPNGPKWPSGEPGGPKPISLDEVFRMYPMTQEGSKRAFNDIRDYFPRRGEVALESWEQKSFKRYGSTYEAAASLADSLLSDNAKTSKAESGEAGIPPSLSMGLVFAPHTLLSEPRMQIGLKHAQQNDLISVRRMTGKVKDMVRSVEQTFVKPPSAPKGFKTVCGGASTYCMESCLLYSGQNQAVESNNSIKAMRLQAFLKAPEAFIRLYFQAIAKFLQDCDVERPRGTKENPGPAYYVDPYIRHNILSDIPWEIICPDLMMFDWSSVRPLARHRAPLRFYDYTKITGRDTEFLGRHRDGSLRYDLTFSFSGSNAENCDKEFRSGRRVAVVFLRNTHNAKGGAESLDDIRFRIGGEVVGRGTDFPIIDGDRHDMRSLDPSPSVVGLRFKARSSMVWSASKKDVVFKTEEELTKEAAAFAKRPGKPVPGQHWLINGFRDEFGNILLAETPRQTCGGSSVEKSLA